ncbi:TPD1 protein homolog 1-like [Andrographis paniculata]|uniref:TPD1 protein homolog 1-like n=1 Tax=Andrographis paniculata TaxID=175694 RepID=UPI0021E89C06|nr:TPD1 protein homolog 1-like [Andrographis paniculata]
MMRTPIGGSYYGQKILRAFLILLIVLSAVAGIHGHSFSRKNAASNSAATANDNIVGDDSDDSGGDGDGSSNRIGEGNPTCSPEDIVVYQNASTPLPSGIPTYTVEFSNPCVDGNCIPISNIHISCGWFSTARLINPAVFHRIAYNDCLLNGGQAINPGETVFFQYANTFKYPMTVSTVSC